jgi:hypothetical protein
MVEDRGPDEDADYKKYFCPWVESVEERIPVNVENVLRHPL